MSNHTEGSREHLVERFGNTLGTYIYKNYMDSGGLVDMQMYGPDFEYLTTGYRLGLFENDLVVKELQRKIEKLEGWQDNTAPPQNHDTRQMRFKS